MGGKVETKTPSCGNCAKPNYRASIIPKTGNLMIADMAPGEYTITINKKVYTLMLTSEGAVTFK